MGDGVNSRVKSALVKDENRVIGGTILIYKVMVLIFTRNRLCVKESRKVT
jgi:hypothetical protein